MGEVLYITLMMRFDESSRQSDETYVDPGLEDDFYSEQTFYYSHGNGILKVCGKPEPGCKYILLHEELWMLLETIRIDANNSK
ncbi:hypothetical protein IWW55_005770 [Coemansia sp. RSA 2706]|nr:hypothetical protein IWW55_005770 [Coemansia sp. RSA 2706]